jgi:hypothetical protein
MNERRTQQQQPAGDRVAREQQMSGSNEFQGKPQQMGEGSYEGARDYKERTERFVQTHDVEKEAEKAKPRSEQEAREMEEAEREGQSHAKE